MEDEEEDEEDEEEEVVDEEEEGDARRGRRGGGERTRERNYMYSLFPFSYVLPFEEVIDWTKAALELDERRLRQVNHGSEIIPTQLLNLKFKIGSSLRFLAYSGGLPSHANCCPCVYKPSFYGRTTSAQWRK